jgi:16S rRNA (guanine527-N7)-methyltransferase
MNANPPKEVHEFLARCGISDISFFIDKCLILQKLLSDENEKYNLTSIRGDDEFWIKHICDSTSALLFFGDEMRSASEICDIGSGAGFPATVISLAIGNNVSAVESSSKKAEFIRMTASKLGVKNLKVIEKRAEEADKLPFYKAKYGIITSRAVSSSLNILKKTSNLISKSGRYIFYKTPRIADSELIELEKKSNDRILWEKSETFDLPLRMGSRVFISGHVQWKAR